MGSHVNPIVANLFMEWFERAALDTFVFEIRLWKRYVDDTTVIISDSLLEEFTREEESDGGIAMLDTKICKDITGTLSFTVYRKPTHTDQYLQFESNQPLHHKLGVIRTLYHCAN